MERSYRVKHLVYVPAQRVLVGACSDVSLRVFTDITGDIRVSCHVVCPASVDCMHFCPETNELLTGSLGLIAFWGFSRSPHIVLGLLRVLDWTCCSLTLDIVVSGLVTESHNSTVYAMCYRHIKSFDHKGRWELPEFRGRSQAKLKCITIDAVQGYLYTGDADGYVQIWSMDKRILLREFRAHLQPVSSVLLRSNTGSLLTASTSGWVKEWSPGGDLLLKFYVDQPGGVRDMIRLGTNCLLFHSPSSMAVWQLPRLSLLFKDTGVNLQVLQRVECGRGKARLLAVTSDGEVQMLCPASGEKLMLSSIMLNLNKALSFAYDHTREELFVADGTPQVLVLDTTRNPCPAKHLICTLNELNDGVMCLEAVQVERVAHPGTYTDVQLCLVFSGHRSGKLELLSPCGLQYQVQQAHAGAIIQTSSLPGLQPLLCCYGTDKQFTIWLVKVEAGAVKMVLNSKVACPFSPVLSRLLPGLVCAISPKHSRLFYSLSGEDSLERKVISGEAVSSLDYCPQLGLLALSGPGGNVEIWDCKGNMLSEIKLGVTVNQVCFANPRGDLLVSFNKSISFISSLHFLPVRLLRAVLALESEDAMEKPVPFQLCSPESYNISLVPRIRPRSQRSGPKPEPPVTTVCEETERMPTRDENECSKEEHEERCSIERCSRTIHTRETPQGENYTISDDDFTKKNNMFKHIYYKYLIFRNISTIFPEPKNHRPMSQDSATIPEPPVVAVSEEETEKTPARDENKCSQAEDERRCSEGRPFDTMHTSETTEGEGCMISGEDVTS